MYQPEFENALNVSLNVSQEERSRSKILDTGFDPEADSWELIVRFSFYPRAFFERHPQVRVQRLTGNYAWIEIPQLLLEEFAKEPGVIYVELPKRLYFGDVGFQSLEAQDGVDSVQASGIPQLKLQLGGQLTGRGVLIGIADSGIDPFHPAFLDSQGKTRIGALWDQAEGREYSQEEINRYLEADSLENQEIPAAFLDLSGHGTAVAGIAAGSRLVDGDFIAQGYATEARLVVVRLAQQGNDDYVRTTQLMQAVDYLLRKATEWNMPMAINLSIGNNYGSHSGNSLLSTYLSEVSLLERVLICVGSGNEAGKPIHTTVVLEDQPYEVILPVAQRQGSLNLQVWKNYADRCEIRLIAPNGTSFRVYQEDVLVPATPTVQQYRTNGTRILLYNGLPSPYQPLQQIFIDLIPEAAYIESGNWRLQVDPVRSVTGRLELWLPAGNILNRGSGFARPSADHTLTVPSASDRVISVGAYNSRTQTYAAFSGRGPAAFTGLIKPDLAAPGVDITAPRAGISRQTGDGRAALQRGNLSLLYGRFTGTSFAAPAVTGTAALLMQWGIVEERNPWLYGAGLKSWFQKQARQIPAFLEYPNPYIGYGVL